MKCKTQDEVDYYWEKLSSGGRPHQCGCLTGSFGVSRQIVPTVLIELLGDSDPVKSQQVMKAMLQMGEIDIEQLQQAGGQKA